VRVLMLKEAMPGGGAERQLALLMKYLPAEWEGRLWSMGDGPFVSVVEAGGHRVDVCPRRARFDVRPSLAVERLIWEWRPDVVHSWDWMSSAAALPVCRALRIPLIDGTIRNATLRRRRPLPRKACMALSTAVVANSAAGLAVWKVPVGKGRVVYNGFDPERLAGCNAVARRPGGPFTIVMTGRMVPEKDFRTLIAAARSLVQEDGGRWRFVLAGGGPDEPSLRAAASDLVAREIIVFVEPGLEVLPLVSEADAGVLLTDQSRHAEGCSNAIMEYMACGLPVVCTAGGGNPELVLDGETGHLVPPRDARALASRLHELAERPDAAAGMGAAGRRRIAERFTVERMVADYVDIYVRATARGRGRSRT
jgi:glycosyltransferase involved in cell wall biosynthesis